MVAEIFNPNAELVIPTGTQTNETNTEIKTQPRNIKAKTSKYLT